MATLLKVNNDYNLPNIGINNTPAPQRIAINNAPNTQQISVPHYTGPGNYSWSTPPSIPQPNPIQSVFGAIRRNVLNPIGSQVSRDAQPIKALNAGVTGLARATAANITHNSQARTNALIQANRRMNTDLAPGKSFVNINQINKGGTALVKPILQGAAENAPYVVGGGAAKLAESTLGKAVASGGTQGMTNFLSSLAQQKLETGKINVGQAAKAAIPAAVLGTAGPLVKPAAKTLERSSQALDKTAVGQKLNSIPIGLSTKDVHPIKKAPGDGLPSNNLPGTRPSGSPGSGVARKLTTETPRSTASPKGLPNSNIPKTGAKVNKPNVPEVPDFLKPSNSEAAKTAKSESAKSIKNLTGHQSQLITPNTKDRVTARLEKYGVSGRQSSKQETGVFGDQKQGSPNRNDREGRLSPVSSGGNYTTNPTKVNIADVKPGDYEKARANGQLASAPVEYAAGQVARVARNLTTSRLGRLVEGTAKPLTASEKEAIRRYRQFADRVHATSQALGGNTPYRANYFHHEWDLSDPKMAAKFEQFRQRKFGRDYNPTEFAGLDVQPRVFDTIAQGEAAGFKLKNTNAAADILDYGKSSAYNLKKQALAKGFQEADSHILEKPHTVDLGQGDTIALSEQGQHEFRGVEKGKTAKNPLLKGYRKTNRGAKQTLLSLSEFHPINITKKVAPGLALKGHPVLATKGAYGAFRAQVGRGYSDKLQQSFQEKGVVDFGARVGSPLKFGSDYETEGKLDLGHAGFGEKTIFEKSMPALHGRALEALKSDLDKKNISYDSPEARAAGTRINEMMGFINTEVRNLDKGHQKFLGDVALAPQFTRAKWATIKSALKDKGVAGSYARRAVIGDTLATATVMLGLGYLAKQKSDNVKDLLIRALVHPSVPTPLKDKKGNTIELGMPSTYSSEALGLVANIKRGKDGHLGIDFKPSSLAGNAGNYGRARLAILPGAGLKVATNTDFANKPLFDPNASIGTKVQQGATTLLGGVAPIGLQGVLQTNAIKSHLPQDIQQVITAGTPGSNPILKSVGSSFGLTPRTDKTVGKGQQTTQYFDTLAAASKGLNRQEKDALDLYTGGKKNPVTGKYEINPTANDSRAKAVALLQNPKVIGNLITMNRTLEDQGQKVDPLWNLTQAQVTKYLQYQAMPPAGADKTDWYNKNKSWYAPLAKQRDAFFNTLPPADPNKPKTPIQFPNPSPAVESAINTYNSLTDSTAKGNFLDNHPEIIKQWNAVSDYNNKMREAQGYAPLKNYPEATPKLQSFMNNYLASDKATRKSIRNANPQQYQEMIGYFDSIDLYNNNKQGAVSQLQGEPDYTSKQAKAISSLAQDIYQNPDGTYSIVPAGWMNGLSNSNSSGSSSRSYKSKGGRKSKGAPKTTLNNVLKAQKAATAAVKPPKLPSAPKAKTTFKAPTLKKQTAAKSGFGQTSRIKVKKGI